MRDNQTTLLAWFRVRRKLVFPFECVFSIYDMEVEHFVYSCWARRSDQRNIINTNETKYNFE
jgi:hypothetical protein